MLELRAAVTDTGDREWVQSLPTTQILHCTDDPKCEADSCPATPRSNLMITCRNTASVPEALAQGPCQGVPASSGD